MADQTAFSSKVIYEVFSESSPFLAKLVPPSDRRTIVRKSWIRFRGTAEWLLNNLFSKEIWMDNFWMGQYNDEKQQNKRSERRFN